MYEPAVYDKEDKLIGTLLEDPKTPRSLVSLLPGYKSPYFFSWSLYDPLSWTDVKGKHHRIVEMSLSHLLNAIKGLDEGASFYGQRWKRYVLKTELDLRNKNV